MREQITKHLEYCKRLLVTDELGKGAYNEKGPVILQLKKKNKDAETPTYEVEIDPWMRYKELEKEFSDHARYGLKGEDKDNWLHPIVKKELAKKAFYDDVRKNAKKDEFFHTGKKLMTINGREVEVSVKAANNSHGTATATAAAAKPAVFSRAKPMGGHKRRPAPKVKEEDKVIHKPDVAEVSRRSSQKRASLVSSMLSKGIEAAIGPASAVPAETVKPKGVAPNANKVMPNKILAEMGLHTSTDEGHAANAEKMWNTMSGAHLTPAAEAELAHVRNMLSALEKSIAAYKAAEAQLIKEGKSDVKVPI